MIQRDRLIMLLRSAAAADKLKDYNYGTEDDGSRILLKDVLTEAANRLESGNLSDVEDDEQRPTFRKSIHQGAKFLVTKPFVFSKIHFAPEDLLEITRFDQKILALHIDVKHQDVHPDIEFELGDLIEMYDGKFISVST